MVDAPANQTPSEVFPLPGWKGTVSPHWGVAGNLGGSDLMAPVGTPVVSMVTGKVVFTSTQATAPTSGGNSVEILGQDGLSYYYAHMLNPVGLKAGDTVVAGQSLGVVDNTGDAAHTASHLHIGIGKGILTGVGPTGGLGGGGYNAVGRLQALENDPRANNPQLANPTATPNPPQIQFDPSVPGFTSANADNIKLVIDQAIKAGVDPFIALGIAAQESTIGTNLVGPTTPSGQHACGIMMLYPCTPDIAAMSPEQNVAEGLKRYKDKLAACNGSITCALNNYSGGGGPLYVGLVTGFAKSIQTANPTLATGGFSIPTIGGTVGTPGVGNITSGPPTIKDCETIKLGSFAGQDINILNPVCIVQAALKNMVNNISNWWKTWQTQHIPNWVFVILGVILIVIGAMTLANSAGMQPPNINLPEGGGIAEEAAVAA